MTSQIGTLMTYCSKYDKLSDAELKEIQKHPLKGKDPVRCFHVQRRGACREMPP